MYTSIETRWFLPDKPDGILKWFESHRAWKDKTTFLNLKTQGERTDHYLDVDGYGKMSFKIREGKTEVKMLDESFGARKFNGVVEGAIEKWIKWGPDLKSGLKLPADVFQNASVFTAVTKRRLLVKYSGAEDHIVEVDPDDKTIPNGCQAELTEIKVGKDLVYSFGFESFGESETLMKNFEQIVDKVLHEIGEVKLQLIDSYSYPVFLKKYS